MIMRWTILGILLLAIGGCAFPSYGTFCETLLRKTGTGAQTEELKGCVYCDDYCEKPFPCTPKVSCQVAK